MNQEDYKLAIDAWLKSLNELETRKIRQIVVCALQAEHRMIGVDTFKIPFHLFESARITNREKQKSILSNLHYKNIIDVSRKINGFTETIIDNPEIIHRPDTIITVFPDRFNYLAKRLDEIVKGYEAQPSPESINRIRKQKIEWQNDFKWVSSSTFAFGNYGSVEFSSPDRKRLFMKLTDAKGHWVPIKVLKSNKDDNYVRTTLSQIEKRMKSDLRKYVCIPSTLHDDAPGKPEWQGAYRIKFSFKP